MERVVLIFLILPVMLFAGTIRIYKDNFAIDQKVKSWIEFKNENIIRQSYDYSCGSASLATIMKYFYDRNVTEKIVLDEVLLSKGIGNKEKKELEDEDFSLSFFDLAEFADAKNFKGIGLAIDKPALKKLKIPVILFVKIRKNEHFTVFKGMDERYVYMSDPSFGNIKVSHAKFDEMFYQRDDLKHPGKILAIVPLERQTYVNKTFLQFEPFDVTIYEVIKRKLF